MTATGLFSNVEHAVFEHAHELPRGALDDHLYSYATIAALPDAERQRVFKEVGDVLDADPAVSDGNRLQLPFVVTAYRATRA